MSQNSSAIKRALRLPFRQVRLQEEQLEMVGRYVSLLEDEKYMEAEGAERNLLDAASEEKLAAARLMLQGARRESNEARARHDLLEAVSWLSKSPEGALTRAAKAAARVVAWDAAEALFEEDVFKSVNEKDNSESLLGRLANEAKREALKQAWDSAYESAVSEIGYKLAHEMLKEAKVTFKPELTQRMKSEMPTPY